MINRCFNVRSKDYKYYGGRGIAVCDRWHEPVNFAADMGERPDGYSIDRIDHNGNYEPSNCRWANPLEQGRNKRNNRVEIVLGKRMTLSEASQVYNIPESTIYNRLNAGMSMEQAVTTPVRKRTPYVIFNGVKMSLRDAEIKTGISQKTLRKKVDSNLILSLS